MSGRSIPQNAVQLYKICYEWIEQYLQDPAEKTVIDIFFEYIDTSSIRCVLDILSSISKMYHETGKQVEINWHYEEDDDDSLDLGEYINANLKVPFNIYPIKEGEDIPDRIEN